MKLLPLAVVPLLLLAACKDEPAPEPETNGNREAQGEILPASVTDEMLPLDRLRSEAPPAEAAPDEEDGEAADGESGEADG